MTALSYIDVDAKYINWVVGFVDKLSVLKVFPKSDSYKQEDLEWTYLNTSYGAQNAPEDGCHLFVLSNVSNVDLLKHNFPPMAFTKKCEEKYKNNILKPDTIIVSW